MSNEGDKISQNGEAGDGESQEIKADISDTSAIHKIAGETAESGSDRDGEAASPQKASGGKSTPSSKPGSPATSRIRTGISLEQRRVRADELRKKKVEESRKKDDERRAAVAERKRRLDEEEKQKREALLKKLEVNITPPRRQIGPKRDRPLSASMSNLHHLQKSQLVTKSVDLTSKDDHANGFHTRTGPLKRPSSAMSSRKARTTSSDPLGGSRKSSVGSTGSSDSRPSSGSRGRLTQTKTSQTSSQNHTELPPRPVSAMPSLGRPLKSKEDRKSTPGLKKMTNVQALPGKPAHPTAGTPPSKSTQPAHKVPTKSKSSSSIATSRPNSGGKSRDLKPKEEGGKKQSSQKVGAKEPGKATHKDDSGKGSEAAVKAGLSSEEEAKKALAERRRKAKEEAEKQAALDKEKREEEERIAREEEEKRQKMIAEMEAERLRHEEQIRLEDEENMRRAAELKEKREREEKEKLEIEQKLREEEMERKAKEELERRAKEREITRQQEEAARLERKKRVEEIMKKVAGSKSDESGETSPAERRSGSPQNVAGNTAENRSGSLSPTEDEIGNESARDRVGKILQKVKASDQKQEKSEEENNNRKGELDEDTPPATENGLITLEGVSVDERATVIVSRSVIVEKEESTMSSTVNGDVSDGRSHVTTEERVVMGSDGPGQQTDSSKQLWQTAEETMMDRKVLIQSALESKGIRANEETESQEEGKLWQVAEGRIELEECF